MSLLHLSYPALFLEFFIREVTYFGNRQSAKFPQGVLFYTGPSNAREVPVSGQSLLPRQPCLGFIQQEPGVLASRQRDFQHWLQEHTPDVFLKIGHEVWEQDRWVRQSDQELYCPLRPDMARFAETSNYAPFQFNVWAQDEQGTLLTDFPDSEQRQTLEVGTTYAFLCRQEQYERNGAWQVTSPHRNLTLFVKNHGLQQDLRLITDSEFASSADPANLCREPFKIRDHRKSRFKYMLG